MAVTLEQIHKDLMSIKKDIEHLKILVAEDYEIADDVVDDIEKSRKKRRHEFITHEQMKKEFG